MLTRQEILREYGKCLSSPIYAIETYLETFDKTQEGFVPFKLFPRQKEIIQSYEKNRFNLITKPRQAGVSTTTAAYFSIKVAFADIENPEAVLIIANKQELAFEFLAKIKDFVSQLPRWVWGPEYYGNKHNEAKTIFLTDSKKEIKLPNGSRVKAVATSKDALRGFTPTYLVMDEAAYIDNGAIVFGAALTALGTGGKATLISCVTDDTFIFSNKGLRQMSDFIDYSQKDNPNVGYYTQEYSIRGLNENRKSNIIVNNGLQKTIKVKTTNSELEATKTHKLWAYSNNLKKFDWFKTQDLEIGDYINIQYGFNIFGNDDLINLNYNFSNKEHKPKIIYDKITPDLAYLIGLYISEGSCYKPMNDAGRIVGCDITITCGDDVREAIVAAGFNYSSHDNLHYKISSKYLGALLENIGFDISLKAPNKYIPNKLLSMSKENTIAMLQGIMDGDGYSDKIRGRIGINLSSKKLCKQLRFLFLNFGILTDYVEGITKPTKKVKVESKYYGISATSGDAKKYFDLIGFRFNRKQVKQNNIKLVSLSNRYRIIPNGKNIIRNIINDHNLTKKLRGTGIKVNDIFLFKKNKTANLSKDKFIKYIEYFKNELNLNLDNYNIDKILFENSKWVPIIDLSESENKTYDFSLPETNDFWCHSIIYNGILGHQTPNGMDKLYYETYAQSKAKKNNFNIIEMKWYEDLRYNKDLRWLKGDEDIAEVEFTFDSYNRMLADGYKPTSSWYEEMCRGMNNDAKMIAQELDVSFIGSGGNVIDESIIEEQNKNNVQEPQFISGGEGEIWIWKQPEEGHQYIMGVDVSRGDGEDSSTIVMLDFTTMEQVMEYQGKIQPDLLAQVVEEYGELYKAYTVVDITGGMGVSTVLKLLEFDYKRLHYDTPNGKILSSKQKQMEAFKKNDKVPGLQVSSIRIQMISNFEEKVRNNLVKIRSVRLTSEMKTFVYKNGRPDHMDGYHDDLIMSLAMCLWVIEHSFKNLERLEKQTKAMLSSWVNAGGSQDFVEDKFRGTAFVPKDNRNKTPTKRPNFSPIVSKNMQDPTGQYMWLFSGTK